VTSEIGQGQGRVTRAYLIQVGANLLAVNRKVIDLSGDQRQSIADG